MNRVPDALAAFVLGSRAPRRSTTANATSAVVGSLALGYLAYRGLALGSNALGLHRLHGGSHRAQSRAPGAAAAIDRYRVSILIPARDEASTLPSTLPLLLAQGADEIVVLDDHSTDETARVARELGVRVLQGEELPEGWIGKTWACQQLADAVTDGAAAVDGESDPREHLLVFTDADVTWHPGALAELVDELDRNRTDLLTVFPRHVVGSFGERVMVPLVDAAFVGHAPVPIIRSRRHGALAANGQVMAFRRAAYELSGGHAAVRGELVEDVRLARRARDAGARFDVVLGGAAIEVRMYDSYAAAVEGMAKSMPGLHRESRLVMVGAAGWFLMTYTLPWLLPATPLLRLVRALGLADRAVVNLLVGRTRPVELAETLLGPISPLAVLPAYAKAISGRLTWRGRTYRAARRGWRP
jgi:Glycosyltransferase like family 2